jgi:serine phosphatase RsbU (regulator of sigma subunit)
MAADSLGYGCFLCVSIAEFRLMPRLNEVLYRLKKPDMFVTFCHLARKGRVRAGLAGHPATLQFCAKSNEMKKWECPNMPLGIVPEGDFVSTEIPAESGDLFALYTDGLLETANAAGEEFGMKRLEGELQKNGKQPLERFAGRCRKALCDTGCNSTISRCC